MFSELFTTQKESVAIPQYDRRSGKRQDDYVTEVKYIVPIPGVAAPDVFKEDKYIVNELYLAFDEIEDKWHINFDNITGDGEYYYKDTLVGVLFPDLKGVADGGMVDISNLPVDVSEKCRADFKRLFPNKEPRLLVGLIVSC